MNHTHRRQLFWNSLVIVLGNALYALTVALFLEPAGLVTGGATGIALAFGRLTGLSVSGFLLVFNLAMLVWGWAVLGRAFALNTLASSILSPVFLALWERLLADRVLTEDIFLCTVFAGLGIGVALGLVIRAGASTGGMDIPPLVLQKWFRLPGAVCACCSAAVCSGFCSMSFSFSLVCSDDTFSFSVLACVLDASSDDAVSFA